MEVSEVGRRVLLLLLLLLVARRRATGGGGGGGALRDLLLHVVVCFVILVAVAEYPRKGEQPLPDLLAADTTGSCCVFYTF